MKYVDLANINNYLVYDEKITLLIGIIIGLVSFMLFFLFSKWQNKRLTKQIKTKYPYETIQYTFAPLKKIVAWMQFFVGVFIGAYLLPFYIFSDITNINMVTSVNLPIFIILAIFSFIFALSLGSYTTILTNKRLVGIFPYNLIKSTTVMLNNIKSIKKSKYGVNIISHDNNIFPLRPKSEAEKCYEVIINLFKMGVKR